MKQTPAATTLHTLSRGLAMLEIIAGSDGKESAKSLGQALGLKSSTCYNLLRTLQNDRFVIKLPQGKYALGERSARLGSSVVAHTKPLPGLSAFLEGLNRATRETAYISGWYQGAIILQEWLPGLQPISVGNLDVGFVGLLHARASGKAILARLPEQQVRAILPVEVLEQPTPASIGTRTELLANLTQVRNDGYAVDNEEFQIGVCCVAAAFVNSTGQPVGAYAVSAPTDRFRLRSTSLSAQVRDAANRASAYLKQQETSTAVPE
ncbi:IclR family transcriptional regulator [Arthrobacter sp. 4R501]|uniref:IclR family transcriptional regulator n=1 Tax=Arthrobacter sp. 4R501 TaxID=2058886 RepID=UPI001C6809BB|nr:IclR family transcriptional regulator [Arthrobacter sp. 4R501]